MERLQRILAARGVASRRSAEAMITEGRVSVDGQIVTELGTKVDPSTAEIRVDGKVLRAQRPRYLILNKPRGYITTTKDERDRRTVMDLVQVSERVYPVGRLDRDTEGLLLLTNDGDVANRVMHPRYELDKEYHVLTLTRPPEPVLQRVRDGVVVDGHRVVPHEFRILRQTAEGLILKMVIHEGTYHLVRNVMDAVGIPVERLRRVRVGPLNVTGLPIGVWRDLTPGEQSTLFEAIHLERDVVKPVARWTADRREARAGRRQSSRSDAPRVASAEAPERTAPSPQRRPTHGRATAAHAEPEPRPLRRGAPPANNASGDRDRTREPGRPAGADRREQDRRPPRERSRRDTAGPEHDRSSPHRGGRQRDDE
ncbi:MAG: rRNA synthase, partial [Thermomicrobiales bacterium]|nr:rRNA synthase [Thermomicrobiales bacterium]